MKKIISLLKSRIAISLFCILIFSFLVWFIGPSVKFGENNVAPLSSDIARLLAIIILLFIWGLSNIGVQFNNRKKDKNINSELVKDLLTDHEDINESQTINQIKKELLQINKRFSQALYILKKDKFNGVGRNNSLYKLPWYLIIGPPGSGKTSALANSSLNFSLSEQFYGDPISDAGGTRNCDWWFSNEAVLIDTAGRYTTQNNNPSIDSSAWKSILDLLKIKRRRRPINGVIITLSLQDILNQSEEERVSNARIIRSRIDELMAKFNIHFPVYLVFTKTDCITGFSEFFEDLSKEEREQVWGVSLPEEIDESQSPDFILLGSELKKLIVRMYDRVLWRINQERNSTRRGRIYGFPIQMEYVVDITNKYVKQVFGQNSCQIQPYLRGVYFSSASQEENILDPFITPISSKFAFSNEIPQKNDFQGRSFFLGDLYRKVIFPESELVGSSKKHEAIMVWSERIAYAVIVVLTIGILFSWIGSVSRHEKYKTQVESFLNEYINENKNYDGLSTDLKSMLPGLNALGKASIVYDQNKHPWLSGIGLYDDSIDAAIDNAYQQKLNTIFLPKLINILEANLKQSHNTGDLYNTFLVYLMFNKTDYMNIDVVRNWFESNMSSYFNGVNSQQYEFESHLNALLSLNLESTKLNINLIRQIRNTLQQSPISHRVYSRIRTNTAFSTQINILNEFGESVRKTFKISPTVQTSLRIPKLFTADGYDNIDLSSESQILVNIVNERWVMFDGKPDQVVFVKNDLEDISKNVKALYFADYTDSWNKIFTALEITKFKSLQHAGDILSAFSDPVYSPLLSILRVSKTNTQLSSPVFDNFATDHDTGPVGMASSHLANKFDGNKVDKQFRNLNNLLREPSNGPVPIDIVIEEINKLKTFVEQVSVSPDPSKRAFEIVRARYQNGSDNPITSLRAFAKNSPEPVQRWLMSLADETWNQMLMSAHTHINSEWISQVYQPYHRGLAGRYPLNRSAKQELELFDFSEFFKPQGTMDKFYLEYIKPFVKSRQRWSNREVDGNTLGISNDALNQLRKAYKIKNLFFRNNSNMPSLEFQMRPFAMSKNDARFTLEIGDKQLNYSHGPKFWKTFDWSSADEDKRVRIVFEDLNDEIHSHTYTGPWAWFRLQDNFKLKKMGLSNIYRVTYVVNQLYGEDIISHKIEYEIKAQSVSNSFGDNSLTTFRCPKNI